MQKKPSRKNGTAATPADGHATAGRAGRTVRVRRRLVIGVAVTGLTVLAAGAPAVVTAASELNDSQQLVTLADRTQQALTLTHLLADERDAVTEYVAKGRPAAGKSVVDDRAAGTDRQLAELRPEADEPLARALGRVRAVRSEAVGGKGGALAAQQAYSALLGELTAPGDRLIELTPPRATGALATTRPLAPLGQAVDQASATRGLLLAALAVPRGEQSQNTAASDELATAAQRSRVRELAALDDFARAARPDVRQTLAVTVTGPEVKSADDYLKRLTDRPALTAADRKLDGESVGAALSARIDRMRSVESNLAVDRSSALAALRDDDVTALERTIAVLGALFLFAVVFATAVARSLTRPLSVLRRGAARLATPEGSVEPVRFTGRNDEFAEVVRHLNAVRDQTVSLHTRIAGLDADRRRLVGRNEALSSGRGALEEELARLRAGLEEHRRIMSTTSVSLSLRTLGLVERQLTVIEELESKEQDPDQLATLFKLDHLATVMRRHNENLLVLAGQDHGPGHATPVPLVDVMRAAVSEIERYERVDLAALPGATQVAGHAADDISHVLAELLENATTFSPPEAKVKVSGWLLDSGDAVLSVIDEGIGVSGDRLAALNARLAEPEAYDEEPEAEHGLGLGLYVAGRLAARHGVTAELRAARGGGTEALVVIPVTLLPVAAPGTPVHHLTAPGAAPFPDLPGVVAEANGNVLSPRLRGEDTPAPAPAPEAAPAPAPAPASEEAPAEAPTPVAVTDAAPEADPAEEPTADAGPEGPADADEAGEREWIPVVPLSEKAPEPAPDAVPADRVFTVPAPAPPTEPSAPDAPEALEALASPEAPAPAEAPVHAEAPADPEPPATPDVPESERTLEVRLPAPPTVPPVVEQGQEPAEELPARVVPAADPADLLPSPDQVFTVPAAGERNGGLPVRKGPGAGLPKRERRTAPAGDAHAQAPDGPGDWVPRQGSHPDEAVTDKGLPKRTPRAVAAPGPQAVAAPATGAEPKRVDAEELRRRLGGFYQGARDGRRVVEAELADAEGQTDPGDTAQEART
ncbi:nitrate- and nitrite sensing domain-containing protein [Streptomyces sp. NPDC006529]|uniref:sensor histidine kinase n=1 Tax=Streptomyces sp. NPDC006529 TaxID=3157177 RepID=UPI0033BCD324